MFAIAADIGGTNTRIACLNFAENKQHVLATETYQSQEFTDIESVIDQFIHQNQISDTIDIACFAIAGPVKNAEVSVTNLTWQISAAKLKEKFNTEYVFLLNDFSAIAYAIDTLDDTSCLTLQQGRNNGNNDVAIIGAGTGLGSCHVIKVDNQIIPLASEAGHASFSPQNHIQAEILQWLWQKNDFVSVESLVSGRGIVNIYQFLKHKAIVKEDMNIAEKISTDDAAKVISENYSKDELCQQTIDLFLELYGAAVRNIVLHYYPLSTVYIAGGIGLKIKQQLKSGKFINAFNHSEKMLHNLKQVEIKLLLDENPGLTGAINYCQLISQEKNIRSE